MIDLNHFTPWTALAGGILIGSGTAVLILFNGKIAGISGILGGLFKNALFKQDQQIKQHQQDRDWRLAFLLGLIISPVIWQSVSTLPTANIETDYFTLAIAGLFVGFSTRYGSGCTSGHGVCGMSRLSLRSIIATLLFMASGAVTVYVIRHVIGTLI